MNIDEIFEIDPYSLDKQRKKKLLNERVHELIHFHYHACPEYKWMMEAVALDPQEKVGYEKYPFLPVRLFKDFNLKSCADEDVVKTMTSSGTTGQRVSHIFLDRKTSANQQKCLAKIVSFFLGKKRLPMLIFDTPAVIKNRNMFSARGAGILGFSIFGSEKRYALSENMELDVDGVKAFLEKHKDEKIFLFGFTYMVWLHFYKKLQELGCKLDLKNGILIHGGGWKKLQKEMVSSQEFKKRLNEVCGILPDNIHDYYGMVEQTGCIYMECKCGHLHASVFSDVIVRRHEDFSIADYGEKGLVEVVSVLPESYPGHILLTEDEGVVLGEDDCPCGLKGKYFKIEGRIKNAEIRGCSDTYATKF